MSEYSGKEKLDMLYKEAGLGRIALKAGTKLGKAVGSTALKTGIKTGKWVAAHPFKSIGMAMTGSYFADKAKDGIKAAQKELQPSIAQPSYLQENIPKIAARVNYRNDNNREINKDYRYMPYIAGGTAAALALAEAIRKKDPMAPFKTMYQGATEGVPKMVGAGLKKIPGGRVFQGMIRKGNRVTKSIADEAVRDYIKKYNLRPNTSISEAARKKIINDYVKNRKSGPIKLLPGLRKIKNKVPSVSDLNKGLGAGVTFGLGNYLVHVAGDKYFALKDNDEQRRIMRESREDDISDFSTMKKFIKNPDSVVKNTYKTPKQRVYSNINKTAALNFKKIKSTLRPYVVDDFFGTMKHMTIRTGAPIALGYLINRNMMGNYEKIKNENMSNPNRIIIEVPLKELDKKRFTKTASTSSLAKKMLKSIKADSHSAVKGIARSLTPLPFLVLTGRDIRNNFQKSDKNKSLPPISPGMARIIIETPIDYSKQDKKAGEILNELYKQAISEKDIANSIDNLISEEVRKKNEERGKKKLINMRLVQGVKKKQRMNR